MTAADITPDGGSFRDPGGRVYHSGGRVLRGVGAATAATMNTLLQQTFFQRWVDDGCVVETRAVDDKIEGWDSVFEHAPLPFITYPYEWTFSMLRDAALLQLSMQEEALKNGWTFKDATPYNMQWRGAAPVFIDVASLAPAVAGAPWAAYRQFCMLYLYPLLLKAHLDIDFNPLLRAELDGITPAAAAAHFHGWRRLKKGVLAHVVFPAAVERKIAAAERDRAPAKKRAAAPQSAAVQFGLLQGLANTVRGLRRRAVHSDWSHYAQRTSYSAADVDAKRGFVAGVAAARRRALVWDLGANTGDYSRLCAEHADCVIAADGDGEAVERLYLNARGGGNIIPLQLNLANLSPAQGFAGGERKAFDRRGRPQLVLCLALVHHLRIAANIPMPLFLDWLRGLDAEVVIEFVDRDDEMTQKLLLNKDETYADYTRENFDAALRQRFEVRQTLALKDGRRVLYHAAPR